MFVISNQVFPHQTNTMSPFESGRSGRWKSPRTQGLGSMRGKGEADWESMAGAGRRDGWRAMDVRLVGSLTYLA